MRGNNTTNFDIAALGNCSNALFSPHDFSASWSTSSGIELKGMSYTPQIQQFIAVKQIKSDWSTFTYTPESNSFSYSDLTTSGVLSISNATLSSADKGYIVSVLGPSKGFTPASNVFRSTEISPLNQNVVEESLYDSTNLAAVAPTAPNYFPSSDGLQMAGWKDFSLTGYMLDADGEILVSVQCSNDEDATAASRLDWSNTFGYNATLNATVSGISTSSDANGIKFNWQFTNLNAKYVRVELVNNGATNTINLKGRRRY